MGDNHSRARLMGLPQSNDVKPYIKRLLRTKEVKPWVAEAIELMVFNGLSRAGAAEKLGKSDLSLRQAFQTEPVMKWYTKQCEVLRKGERHMNITEAVRIRDESESDKARLEAIKVLETDFDAKNKQGDGLSVNINIAPGYILGVSHVSDKAKLILEQSKRAPKVIEHEQD